MWCFPSAHTHTHTSARSENYEFLICKLPKPIRAIHFSFRCIFLSRIETSLLISKLWFRNWGIVCGIKPSFPEVPIPERKLRCRKQSLIQFKFTASLLKSIFCFRNRSYMINLRNFSIKVKIKIEKICP